MTFALRNKEKRSVRLFSPREFLICRMQVHHALRRQVGSEWLQQGVI